jgi:hypothetical protein
VIRAVGAAVRELAPARQPVIQPVLLTTTVIGHSSLTGVGTITAIGGLAMAPMRVSGQATVENLTSGKAARRIGQILGLVLVAFGTWRLLSVPPSDQAAAGYYLAVIGFALTVATLICSWTK